MKRTPDKLLASSCSLWGKLEVWQRGNCLVAHLHTMEHCSHFEYQPDEVGETTEQAMELIVTAAKRAALSLAQEDLAALRATDGSLH